MYESSSLVLNYTFSSNDDRRLLQLLIDVRKYYCGIHFLISICLAIQGKPKLDPQR